MLTYADVAGHGARRFVARSMSVTSLEAYCQTSRPRQRQVAYRSFCMQVARLIP
jgi:hypothetical protein